MISDILSEAIDDIDFYLNEPLYSKVYSGDLREEIIALRDKMTALRVKLDTPPDKATVE